MTARLDSALVRMDALIADVHADCERESGIIALAPVVPIQRASTSTVIKRCACGRSYTEASWAKLARVGIMSDGDGGCITLRNCTCGSTLAMVLVEWVTT